MNVLRPVSGTFKIWFGAPHGPWKSAPGVVVRRRKVQDAPMIAEKNMISVTRSSQVPSFRPLDQPVGHGDSRPIGAKSHDTFVPRRPDKSIAIRSDSNS